MQAKDIPEAPILDAIKMHATNIGCQFGKIAEALPEVPQKVLRAKLSSMVKRGIISGCVCGCRGDFNIARLNPITNLRQS